jgi:hypothetical protein
VLFELARAIHFDEFERAASHTLALSDDFEQRLRGGWGCPRFAMLGAIALAERHAVAPAGERRALRRRIRQHRRVARRYARRCPSNYGAMLAIIDAELEGLRGRYEVATATHERARTIAARQDMHDLVALGSRRLARLYRKRGLDFAADAAQAAAVDAYRRWGATAVVERLAGEVGTSLESE